ncbi:MAG TPA: aldehyde dehydrogenase family protein, partial [Paracoccaceae bacterium]|nr:aldehyde dehydrogenase family protein [Paracoccaceae bacterium]
MASSAAVLDVRNPRTGKTDHTITLATAQDVAAKAARLRAAQVGWEALGVGGRCAVMARWLGEVKVQAMAIGEADAVDTGGCHTSYVQGFITMGNIGGWLEDAPKAFAALEWHGMSSSMPTVEVESQVVAYPLVGVISPWNAPLMLALLDAVPALFAGSAVLLKPSEVTPRVIETLFETVRAVPELAAVFDYVAGAGDVGQAVIGQADTICFTGSVPTGRKVAVACAERLIPCNLELGGKDPCIVTETADLERAATAVLRGAVYATGQVCYSVERVYVHQSVHDAFVALLVDKAKAVRLNAENPRAGHIGPFTFAAQADIVLRHIQDAKAKGAKVLTGGEVENIGGGLYLRPTVLTGVTHDMEIMQDETFG